MRYVENVAPNGRLEIECFGKGDYYCLAVSDDYVDYSHVDFIKRYRSFGLSRRSAEYLYERFDEWYNE